LPFEERLDALLRIDVRATVLLTREAGKRFRDAGGGTIINLGWDQALTGMAGDGGELFATAKGAVMAFTKSAALTLAPSVRVNCIAPGWIRTAWAECAGTAWQERADTLAVPGTPDAPRVFVPMAAGADAFLLPVREGNRITLHALDATGADLVLERTMDGGNLGTLRADLSRAVPVADDVGAVIEQALDEAALVTAGQMLGLAEKAFELTLGYLRTRQQFGRIIGTFQALQHRAADLKIHISLIRAAVESAAAALDAGATGAVRQAAVSKAKHRAIESGMLVLRQCIQLHGGIGYTDEYDVGLYLRRGMVIMNQYGSANLHRRRFMALAPEDVE
jgi:hypothetical protein